MLASAFLALCCVLFSTREVQAQHGIAIKKTQFPYVGYIFYPDETLVEAIGARYIRVALLIKPDWLVSAAVDPLVPSGHGFPQKTLLARLGATNIDRKFTLNEDEDEQEREVVKLVRPFKHEFSSSWRTDITLLKTLFPFNPTLAVGVLSLNLKHTYTEKSCTILAFMPGLEDKTLTQLNVEILPKCGEGFDDNTTVCAIDGEDTKEAMSNPEFCIGNSGGPLICEGEVMGLQTYISNNCSAPHLYQRFSGWQTFITCGTEDKCNESQCSGTCAVTNKDIEINRTQESTVVPAISISSVSLPDTSSISPGSNVTVSKKSGCTEFPTDTTESLKLASQPEQARISNLSKKTDNQILQYNDFVTVASAGKTELAPITTTIKLKTEEIEGGVKSDENITEHKTPKNISTSIVEPFASRPESGLVIKETIQPKEVSYSRASEIKKRVKVHEGTSSDEPGIDARKVNMEAQIEDTQAVREPQPVPTRNLYRLVESSSYSSAVKLHSLCYEIAIVFTLLVIAM